jgi:hypothetical protein
VRAFASFLINILCAANFAFWNARAHFGHANDPHRRLGLQPSSLSASALYAWASFFEPAAAFLAARTKICTTSWCRSAVFFAVKDCPSDGGSSRYQFSLLIISSSA